MLCILAANAPDVDVAILLGGDRWTYLHNHRGITHSIVGVASLAILLPLIFYGVDRLCARLRHQRAQTKLGGLMLASILVTATHPLLDWTNSYGIRFLLPWNSRWFYGDLVFIVDPYLWLLLGGSCFLLSAKTRSGKIIWGAVAAVLTALVIISPRAGSVPAFFVVFWIAAVVGLVVLFVLGVGQKWGRKIAYNALWMVVMYWLVLDYAHGDAHLIGTERAELIVKQNGETIGRRAAMPTLANPFRWDYVFETDRATYRFSVDIRSDSTTTLPAQVIRYEKPFGPLAGVMQQVSTERPARIFLDFARFPVAQLADPNCTTATLVRLADLRYTEPGRSRGAFGLELPVDCPTNIRANDKGGR